LVTSIYDATGKKVYELTTVIKNRDAVMLTLKKPVSAKGIYLVKNILNNKFIETRKIVVE
ncbi:MAG TPA: T9SS type A sorting domain-containing protein, partial [Ferruginibacter sp.]|nr:T9SS type A sorting domain-containing protein [Ferruginibacter sp.]